MKTALVLLATLSLMWDGVYSGDDKDYDYSSQAGVDSSHTDYAEPCQPISIESSFPPEVPHQVLNESFLSQFDEIMVIGDVHGCYTEQQMLLERHNADNDKVLKIFAGDLTRGGPKNIEVIRFMQKCKSCLSVRGNNDEKTVIRQARWSNNTQRLVKLDKWMKDMTPEDVKWMRSLPYTISLPSLQAIVVHGGFLPGGVKIEDNMPYTMMNIRDVIPAPHCPGGWRPTRDEFVTYPWASKWTGPTHVYFGHDHKRQLQLYPFATGVDTSCCRGHYMTGHFFYGPRKGTFVTQPALAQYYHGKV